jgi:hypothetical protein
MAGTSATGFWIGLPRPLLEDLSPSWGVVPRGASIGKSGATVQNVTTAETMIGSLAEMAAADLLRLLSRADQSGLLKVGESSPHWAALAGGTIVVAGSASGPGIVQACVAMGVLTTEQGSRHGHRDGAHDLTVLPGLVAEVGADALRPVVRIQTVNAVFQMLLPTGEQYAFQPSPPHQLAEHFSFDVDEILPEASSRVEEWTDIAASIPSTQTIFRPRRQLNPDLTEIRLTAEQWSVVAALDGRRSVGQTIGAVGRSAFDVCSILHGLLNDGLIERTN